MQVTKRIAAVFALILLLAGSAAARAQQDETLPTDKAGWVKRLSKIADQQGDDWWVMYKFRGLDPELSYPVIRELWGKKISDALKTQLLYNFTNDSGDFTMGPNGLPLSDPKINPHLLEILDLGVSDSSDGIRHTAINAAYNVAMQPFKSPDEYKAWRKKTAGRPIAEIAKENCRELFTKFVTANRQERGEILPQVARLSFSSGTYGTSVNGKEIHGVLAHGLTGIRRQAALETGLLDAVAGLLRLPPETPANPAAADQAARQILYFLLAFTPDAAFMEKIEPDVRAAIKKQQAARLSDGYETVWFLNAYSKSAWATDLLLKIVAARYPGSSPWMLTNALCARDDPRVVPALIAVLEDCGAGEDQAIHVALARITGAKPDADADADWWQLWRRKNANKFSPEVAALPIPKLKGLMFNLVSIRRKKSLMEIADDPRRAYWLISSGLILTPDNAEKTRTKPVSNGKMNYILSPPLPDKPAAPPVIAPEKKPGLLVVLTDGMETIEAQKTRWQEIAAQAFDGKFLIALARSPQADRKEAPLWPLKRDAKTGPNSDVTTESLVAAIVADAAAKYPLNRERIFLAGIGAGGSAAYACSLEAKTPFHGFLLLDAPFRSAELPPLTNGRNRRYYLLHHKQNRRTPFFIASAAQESLTKAGAVAQLAEYPALPDNAPTPDADALAAAVRWLEK